MKVVFVLFGLLFGATQRSIWSRETNRLETNVLYSPRVSLQDYIGRGNRRTVGRQPVIIHSVRTVRLKRAADTAGLEKDTDDPDGLYRTLKELKAMKPGPAVQKREDIPVADREKSRRKRRSLNTQDNKRRAVSGSYNTQDNKRRAVSGSYNTQDNKRRAVSGSYNTQDNKRRAVSGSYNTQDNKRRAVSGSYNTQDNKRRAVSGSYNTQAGIKEFDFQNGVTGDETLLTARSGRVGLNVNNHTETRQKSPRQEESHSAIDYKILTVNETNLPSLNAHNDSNIRGNSSVKMKVERSFLSNSAVKQVTWKTDRNMHKRNYSANENQHRIYRRDIPGIDTSNVRISRDSDRWWTKRLDYIDARGRPMEINNSLSGPPVAEPEPNLSQANFLQQALQSSRDGEAEASKKRVKEMADMKADKWLRNELKLIENESRALKRKAAQLHKKLRKATSSWKRSKPSGLPPLQDFAEAYQKYRRRERTRPRVRTVHRIHTTIHKTEIVHKNPNERRRPSRRQQIINILSRLENNLSELKTKLINKNVRGPRQLYESHTHYKYQNPGDNYYNKNDRNMGRYKREAILSKISTYKNVYPFIRGFNRSANETVNEHPSQMQPYRCVTLICYKLRIRTNNATRLVKNIPEWKSTHKVLYNKSLEQKSSPEFRYKNLPISGSTATSKNATKKGDNLSNTTSALNTNITDLVQYLVKTAIFSKKPAGTFSLTSPVSKNGSSSLPAKNSPEAHDYLLKLLQRRNKSTAGTRRRVSEYPVANGIRRLYQETVENSSKRDQESVPNAISKRAAPHIPLTNVRVQPARPSEHTKANKQRDGEQFHTYAEDEPVRRLSSELQAPSNENSYYINYLLPPINLRHTKGFKLLRNRNKVPGELAAQSRRNTKQKAKSSYSINVTAYNPGLHRYIKTLKDSLQQNQSNIWRWGDYPKLMRLWKNDDDDTRLFVPFKSTLKAVGNRERTNKENAVSQITTAPKTKVALLGKSPGRQYSYYEQSLELQASHDQDPVLESPQKRAQIKELLKKEERLQTGNKFLLDIARHLLDRYNKRIYGYSQLFHSSFPVPLPSFDNATSNFGNKEQETNFLSHYTDTRGIDEMLQLTKSRSKRSRFIPNPDPVTPEEVSLQKDLEKLFRKFPVSELERRMNAKFKEAKLAEPTSDDVGKLIMYRNKEDNSNVREVDNVGEFVATDRRTRREVHPFESDVSQNKLTGSHVLQPSGSRLLHITEGSGQDVRQFLDTTPKYKTVPMADKLKTRHFTLYIGATAEPTLTGKRTVKEELDDRMKSTPAARKSRRNAFDFDVEEEETTRATTTHVPFDKERYEKEKAKIEAHLRSKNVKERIKAMGKNVSAEIEQVKPPTVRDYDKDSSEDDSDIGDEDDGDGGQDTKTTKGIELDVNGRKAEPKEEVGYRIQDDSRKSEEYKYSWSDWSECSATCGLGQKFRTNRCGDNQPCTGNLASSESKVCSIRDTC